jgi:hypothetical protein
MDSPTPHCQDWQRFDLRQRKSPLPAFIIGPSRVNSDCIKQWHQTPRKHAQRIKKASKIVKKSTTLRIIGAIFLFGIILFGAAINHTGPAIVLAFFGLGIAYEYFVVWPQVKREKATAASQADAVK